MSLPMSAALTAACLAQLACGGLAGSSATDVPCGSACSGSCIGRRCLTTLATGRTSIVGIPLARNDSAIFWTDQYDSDGKVPAYVRRVSLEGGSPSILSSATGSYQGIAADAENVYWTDLMNGLILEVPVTGGATTTLASGLRTPHRLAINDSHVYWTNILGRNVMAVAKAGGAPTVLATMPCLATQDVAADDVNVYWSASGLECSGGSDRNAGVIVKVPVGGGLPTTLATHQAGADSIALDAANVYWVNDNDNEVMRVPKEGGVPVTLATSAMFLSDIAVDSSGVYLAALGMPTTGAVLKVPLAGGAPETLASGPTTLPAAVLTDATSVYWLTYTYSFEPDTLMRLTPK
jgi:hypothetical protein